MDNVNMSQNAEQTAIGNVPPGGQEGVKRQVSADAFRALTMRLNGGAAAAKPPAPAPTPVQETPTINAAPGQAVPAVQQANGPVAEPVPQQAMKMDQPIVEPATAETAVVEPEAETENAELSGSEPFQIPEVAPLTPQPVVPEQETLETEIPAPLVAEPEPVAEVVAQVVDQTEVNPTALVDTTEQMQAPQQSAPMQAAVEAVQVPDLNDLLQQARCERVQGADSTAPTPQSVAQEQAVPQAQPAAIQDVSPVAPALQPEQAESSAMPPQPQEPDTPPASAQEPLPQSQPQPVERNEAEAAGMTLPQEIDPLVAAMNLIKTGDVKVSPPVVPEFAVDEFDIPALQPSETAARALDNDAATIVEEAIEQSEPESLSDDTPGEQPQAAEPAGPVVADADVTPVEVEPDAESGETARALLDMMSSTSGGSQPQERGLAADTLLRLVPRMMTKDLVALAERVGMMDDAPSLLVNALINHPEPRVAAPLLEEGNVIAEQDMLRLIATTRVDRLIMMAKRRVVTQTICDALIARGEPSVYLTLVRNPGAALSHDAFVALCEIAKSQPSLQAPLATRGDTPPPIAFELFWSLPVELRRYVLSRFLTDSATLDKILKITQSVDGSKSRDHKFPPKRKTEALIELIVDGVIDEAAEMMAELAGANVDNARRIIVDPDGEPLTVMLKTMGLSRADFGEAIKKCASSSKAMLRSDRNLHELQIMFDSLSFNKARTLLTYWDWAVEKTGPYSRRVM